MSPPVNAVRSDTKLPAAADVVVIGGGIIGCMAAYYLAKKKLSVAVVEKGRIAGEQSSRNWGWCRQQGRDVREIPLIREALTLWGGLNEAVGAETGFRRTGLIYVTKNAAELARWEHWLDEARQYQLHTRLLSAAEAQALMPGCEDKWVGGLHTPSDGRAEPALAGPAIAAAVQKLGVTLHQNCAARGIESEAGAVSAVVTEAGTIGTRAVLCAAGVWSRLFCRRHGVDLPQLGVRASVLRTEPGAEVLDKPVSSPHYGFRRRLDGGYTVGMRGAADFEIIPDAFRYLGKFWTAFQQGRPGIKLKFGKAFFEALGTPHDWAFDKPTPFEATRILDPEPDLNVLNKALANFKTGYPALRGLKIAETWAGVIDTTPDAIPVISPVEALKGFYLATGFSGHGFGISPGAGRLAADIVAGDTPLVDPHPFRFSRMHDGSKLIPQAGL